jgi:flagellar export protein FliJ
MSLKNKLRLIKKVEQARQKLRDIAASHYADAENQRLQAEQEQQHATNTMLALLDDASERFQQATNVNEFFLFAEEKERAQEYLAYTEEVHTEAAEVSHEKRLVMQKKERELRSAEKLREKTRSAYEDWVTKEEQKILDDLSGAKFGRRPR